MAKTASMDKIAVQLEDIAKDITGTPIAKGGYAWDIIDDAVTTIAEAVGAEIPEKKFSTKKDRVAALVNAIADADVSGGGGDEDAFIDRTISEYKDSTLETVGCDAFTDCSNLTTVNLPACKSVGDGAFIRCFSLTTVSLPACTSIGDEAFAMCTNFTTADFPACTTIGSNVFWMGAGVTTLNLPAVTSIGSGAFTYLSLETVRISACSYIGTSAFSACTKLLSLYMTGSSYVSLAGSNAFSSTTIGGYTSSTSGQYGSIYVPASMIDTYKSMTNWAYFSSRFVAYDE